MSCAVVLDVFSRRIVGWSIDACALGGSELGSSGVADPEGRRHERHHMLPVDLMPRRRQGPPERHGSSCTPVGGHWP